MTPAERLARRLTERNRLDSALAPPDGFNSCGCIYDGPDRIRTCTAHQH